MHPKTRDEIKDFVIRTIADKVAADESDIGEETDLVKDLNIDSMDTVELAMDFEHEFEISIPDEDTERLLTVGQVIDFIDVAINGTGGSAVPA